MILVGNQRGGAYDLAAHLMKPENERVTIHEIRGFVADDLRGAFQESYAISRGTRCKQHLYSLSLNPPKEETVSSAVFEDAIDRAEERLGLTGQPRVIVFHEKKGVDGQVRHHAHAVWCRIDVENMRAVQISYDRRKLQSLGRELYLDHGWKMPRGFVNSKETNPRNYTLAEWQQAKRAKKDPAKLKGVFQDCWAISDSQTSFAHALKEHGYVLARGDRRGAVAVDHKGEVYSIRQYVGIKPKQMRERIKDDECLPDVATAHRQATSDVTDRLRELETEQRRAAKAKLDQLAERRRRAAQAQRDYAKRMRERQEARAHAEEQERQARIRKGWRGLLDRLTGKRKRIEAENRDAAAEAIKRDQGERKILTERQEAINRNISAKMRATKSLQKAVLRELGEDIDRLDKPPPTKQPPKDRDKKRDAYIAKEKREAKRPRRRRSRVGPSPDR